MIRNLLLFLLGAWPIVTLAGSNDKPSPTDWAVQGAPYRVTLRADTPPVTPEAGWEICLPDFGAGRCDMRDVVLLDSNGKEIPLDPIWRGQGRSLLLLAQSMPAGKLAATLYFGGNTTRRMSSWSAKRSLLLETRRLRPGSDVTTIKGWQAAWKKSSTIDGVGFVPTISHHHNPFGASNHFLSRYSGVLQTGGGGPQRLYTQSDDVSYVKMDGHEVLRWLDARPPPLNPEQSPSVKLCLPKAWPTIEYYHAAVDSPTAMVLGWNQDAKPTTVPPEAWVHPGKVTSDPIEAHDGAPVPSALLEIERSLSYGGEWAVMVKGVTATPPDGWQVEWLWPDGHLDLGSEMRRLWMGRNPVPLTLRLRNGIRVIEGQHVLVIPQDTEIVPNNSGKQLDQFLELLNHEDPTALSEPARRTGFVLASEFLPAVAAARWAEAWLTLAKPAPGPWVAAMSMAISQTANRDAKAALERLLALPPTARATLGKTAKLLELDLRIFGLNDPLVVGLATRLSKSNDKKLARMALIRLGDYHLLNGHIDEAAHWFALGAPGRGDAERVKAAGAIDASHALAIEEFVHTNHLDEARAKLEEWELLRPAAKIDGDQLLWRARVMFLAGAWPRASQDLQTSLKVRPSSPEKWDVLFWQGRALYELELKEEARMIWNGMVKDFPNHERIESAKAWALKP